MRNFLQFREKLRRIAYDYGKRRRKLLRFTGLQKGTIRLQIIAPNSAERRSIPFLAVGQWGPIALNGEAQSVYKQKSIREPTER